MPALPSAQFQRAASRCLPAPSSFPHFGGIVRLRRGGRDERICRNWCFRQIVVAVKTPTLAEKLGLSPHDSALLRKVAGLGLGPSELQTLAVQRGCIHYSTGTKTTQPLAAETEFSNEELAVALLCLALPYDPRSIRCGAAMLGAEGNSAVRLAQLTIQEQSVISVRHVAEAGRKFEPENRFWPELLALLPPVTVPASGALLHPTRFVAMTGFTRKGPGLVVEWQRPGPRPVAA